jgi:hypothetical protein
MQEELKMNDKTRLRKKLDERIRDLSKAERSLFEIMICTDTGNVRCAEGHIEEKRKQ